MGLKNKFFTFFLEIYLFVGNINENRKIHIYNLFFIQNYLVNK